MLRSCLAGIAVGALLAPPASGETLDEVIAKNIQARGGLEKLRAVQSARMTGRMSMGAGMEAPFVLEIKRPNMMRVEFTVQGMTAVQAYDGKTAWMIMPFMGKGEPEPLPADQARQIAEDADFDGPLLDYRSKGHAVELLGKDTVEGTEAYKLKVTLKGGDVRYYYLDAESFLEIRTEGRRKVQGTEMDVESTIGDYKEVGGLMLPHSVENGAKGMPMRQKLSLEKIELNVPVDGARFRMPEVKKLEPKPEPKPKS